MPSVLRRERRVWGLTQNEVARLIGFRTAEQCSRLEKEIHLPSSEVLLSSAIVFDVPIEALFPRFYTRIEEKVLLRAAAFYEELQDASDPASIRKREFLDLVMQRAIARKDDARL